MRLAFDNAARELNTLPPRLDAQSAPVTESDRQLLAPLVKTGESYTFGRAGGSPSDIAEFDRMAERLLQLQRDGYIVLSEAMMDYTRPGDHFYLVRARLTPLGRDALLAPL